MLSCNFLHKIRVYFLLSVPLLITSCSNNNSIEHQLVAHRGSLIRQGMSSTYADGYIDGCSTGKHDAAANGYFAIKDHNRYKVDEEYTVAFEHGYDACLLQAQEEDGTEKIWEEMKK